VGLLKHLLFWPVTGPSFLTRFSIQKVEGAVRTELTDDASIKKDLMELQMQLELGDIDEDQYIAAEAEIMARFRQVREWRERFGMATSGGLVRVAEDADSGNADSGDAAARDEDRPPRVARTEEAEIDVSLGFDDEE
jgi:hypothetical protein